MCAGGEHAAHTRPTSPNFQGPREEHVPALQRGSPGHSTGGSTRSWSGQDVNPVCTSSEPHPDLPDPDLMIGPCVPREPRGSVDQKTWDAFPAETLSALHDALVLA